MVKVSGFPDNQVRKFGFKILDDKTSVAFNPPYLRDEEEHLYQCTILLSLLCLLAREMK